MSSKKQYLIYGEMVRRITHVGGALSKSQKGIGAGIIPLSFDLVENAIRYLGEVWAVVSEARKPITELKHWPKGHFLWAEFFEDAIRELRGSYGWDCDFDRCFIFDSSIKCKLKDVADVELLCASKVEINLIRIGVILSATYPKDFRKRSK